MTKATSTLEQRTESNRNEQKTEKRNEQNKKVMEQDFCFYRITSCRSLLNGKRVRFL